MIALYFPCWRSSSLVSYIVTCRWLPSTFPAEELLHLYHILLHADDCLNTFPVEELLHLYHILLHADDCLIYMQSLNFTCIIYCYMLIALLSLLKSFFTCIIYCYMQMIALYFPCWRASSLVSYIVTCRWLPYTFPAEELLHLYHILLHADDCLILSLLKIFFTCIIYCYMQMIAFYFPCWRATSLVSYIVTCRWLP